MSKAIEHERVETTKGGELVLPVVLRNSTIAKKAWCYMTIGEILKGSSYSQAQSIDEVAQTQLKRHITVRGALPPRPHSLNLPFGTVQEAAQSMRAFEERSSAFVDAATALYEAVRPSWEEARMVRMAKHQNQADTPSKWRDIFAHYNLKKTNAFSWDNSLPLGTNAPSARKTNCYGYACNKAILRPESNMGQDLHPGQLAGLEYWDRDAPIEPGFEAYAELDLPARSATVHNVLSKALADGLSLDPIPGGYPVYFALSGDDYHWYRQDRTGYWSHKPGGNPVRNRDGDGTAKDRLITNPMSANRVHGYTSYSKGGCFLWVPPDLANRSEYKVYEPMDSNKLFR